MTRTLAVAVARGVAAVAAAAAVVALVVLVVRTVSGDGERSRASGLGLRARPASAPFAGYTESDVAVGGRCLRVVVADSVDERVQGLRSRSSLGPYDGMLFVFGGPTEAPFTMTGVPVPLDVGFYGGDGAPVSRLRMRPCAGAEARCPVYGAGATFEYALETLRGGLPPGALSPCQ